MSTPRLFQKKPQRTTPTRTEQEVMGLLFRGYTTNDIAAMRGRAIPTIEHHLTSLRLKTKTHNVQEMIYEALIRGWLKPPTRYVD